jgi:hypothetical protein
LWYVAWILTSSKIVGGGSIAFLGPIFFLLLLHWLAKEENHVIWWLDYSNLLLYLIWCRSNSFCEGNFLNQFCSNRLWSNFVVVCLIEQKVSEEDQTYHESISTSISKIQCNLVDSLVQQPIQNEKVKKSPQF